MAQFEIRLFSSIRAYLVRSTLEAVVTIDDDVRRHPLDELGWHRRAREPGWEIIDAWPPPTPSSR